MIDNMYAVVIFTDDQTVSEIPINWLIEVDEQINSCWWPKTKNCSALITKRSVPDEETWDVLGVTVEKYCKTLEKARKVAENADFTTEEEGPQGKGHRQRFIPSHLNSSSESDTSIDDKNKKANRKKTSGTIRASNNKKIVISEEDSDSSCSPPAPKKTKKKHFAKGFTVPSPADSFPAFTTTEELNRTDSSLVPSPITPDPQNNDDDDNDSEQVVHSNESIGGTENILLETSYGLQEKLDNLLKSNIQVLREITKLSVELADVKQRVDRIGTPAAVSGPTEIVRRLMPLRSIEQIENFDNQLRNDATIKSQFETFVVKIGGPTARDNIQNVFGKIIANEVAVKCSWHGRKGNFAIGDLAVTSAIRDPLLQAHQSLTEHEFRSITAEWLRFSQQRLTREQQKTNQRRQ